jgi:hypothetical protein
MMKRHSSENVVGVPFKLLGKDPCWPQSSKSFIASEAAIVCTMETVASPIARTYFEWAAEAGIVFG